MVHRPQTRGLRPGEHNLPRPRRHPERAPALGPARLRAPGWAERSPCLPARSPRRTAQHGRLSSACRAGQVVHVEDGTAIRRVMIGGRVVVEDGRVLTADMGRVRALAEAAVERMRAATGSARLTAELLEPSLIGACQALAALVLRRARPRRDAPARLTPLRVWRHASSARASSPPARRPATPSPSAGDGCRAGR
jgi:hypothetical protein